MNKASIFVAVAALALLGCGNGLSESKAEKMLKDMVNKQVSFMSGYTNVRVTKVTHYDEGDSWSVDYVATDRHGGEDSRSGSFRYTGEKWCLSGHGGVDPCAFEFSRGGDFLKESRM